MAYDPENNPYIPGDPASYDLKWIVDQLQGTLDANEAAAQAQASAEAAADSASAASESAASIKDIFVTPEMFGAKGDGIADDLQAINAALDSGADHIVMSKKYYISSPITNLKSNQLIDGGGRITSASAAFEIDGVREFTIKDLNIYFTTYGIHITSTASYVQYSKFENLVLTGSGSGSIGIYIERTTSHLNEIVYRHIICWNVNKGFVIYNPTVDIACNDHKFEFCSAESALDCGWDITNSSGLVLLFCRTAETNGLRVRSSGTCNRMIIMTTYFTIRSTSYFSSDTNGAIYGCLRAGQIYDNTFGAYARIVSGKIIPCDALLTEAFGSDPLNSDASYPFFGGGNVAYYTNSFHKFAGGSSTLTLDADYYGGRGLINDVYIYMGSGAGQLTIVNGDQTVVIASDSSGRTIHLKFVNVSGGRRWRYNLLSAL